MASGLKAWRRWLSDAPLPTRQGGHSVTTEYGRLIFRDPPPQPNWKPRDIQAALNFINLEEAGKPAPPPPAGDLADKVASTSWYHTIELPGGIRTPGQFDHKLLLDRYGLPVSLAGRKAIDVATFDGYWAFEMERRGATVTALDIDGAGSLDLPNRAKKRLADYGTPPAIGKGFAIAHEALGSSVTKVISSVYDLDPDKHGTFDFAHCGDLLLHLRNPLRALEAIRSVTTGTLLLCDVFDPNVRSGSLGPAMTYRGGWADVTWWVPSFDALAQLVIDAGFSSVKVNSVYQLAKTNEPDGYWRASITATV